MDNSRSTPALTNASVSPISSGQVAPSSESATSGTIRLDVCSTHPYG